MELELYYNYINDDLSRYALDELIALWDESIYLGSTGAVTRAVIERAIPSLIDNYSFGLN